MSFLDNIRDWFNEILEDDGHVVVTVIRNDTLWSICERASGAKTNAEIVKHVDQVVALNPGIDPDRLQIGQQVKLPRSWSA